MKVALYPRVSTADQYKDGYSIGEQIERLTKYCEAMGWDVFKIYTDPGYSGATLDRPGLNNLIADVEAGLIDKVLVYKLDRLSRSQLDTLYLIEKIFLANNTDFVSMSENFDTSTPFGRAMIGILAVFAQLEREQIKERMTMGKEARAKEGKWHGGSAEPIGYNYNPVTDELEINEFEKMQVLEAVDMFLNGSSLYKIETTFAEKGFVHRYGEWTAKTLRSVFRNKLYCGYIKHKDTHYPGLQTPFYSEEIHNKLVSILDERAETSRQTGIRYGKKTTFLGGLLHCKHCKGKYSKTRNGYNEDKSIRYCYTCYSRHKRLKAMIKDPNCKNKIWKMVELDEIIFNEIRKLRIDPAYIESVRNKSNAEDDTPKRSDLIRKEIASIDEQISRFMDLYGIGKFTIEQISEKIEPLNDNKQALQKELNRLNAETGTITVEETLKIAESFEEVLESGDFDDIRSIIEQLIRYIELDNDDIYIHWKFE